MVSYEEVAKASRLKTLELVYKAQTSHIGSLFGCADIFAVLFEHINLEKDKFVLSAGWKAAMLYYHLWRKGKMTTEELDSYCMLGSKFIGLAEPVIPEIPFSGGSMGLGFPASIGFALSKKLKNEEGHIYVLMSDGEQQCGTTWEAAAIAAHHKLDNLTVIVEINRFQAMGKTHDILKMAPLKDKWTNFGWDCIEVNGHNYPRLERAIQQTKGTKPFVVLAHTIKGRGVSSWENNNLWHYAQVKKEDFEYAQSCLN